MITPEDIQTKEFGKSVRGYKEEDVDQFLDDLTLDYEAVLKENEQLKQELSDLQDKYKDQEESIYYTLQSAKQLMSDISTSAERRAEILLKNAQLDADNLTRQTRSSLAYLQEQEAVMKNRVFKLKSKIKSILEAELEDINTIELDLFHEEIPDTVDKLMSYSAEFDGFFGTEELPEEDNRKTLIVAAPSKNPVPQIPAEEEKTGEPETDAEEPAVEENIPAEEDEIPTVEEVIQAVEEIPAAEEVEEIIHSAEDLMAAAETEANVISKEISEEKAAAEEFMNEFIFTLSDELASEDE